MTTAHVEQKARLDEDEIAAVVRLIDAATGHDGVKPIGEHVMLHLRYSGEPDAGGATRSLLIHHDAKLVGYAHLDSTDPVEGPVGELAVHPDHRGQGHGRALVAALLDAAPEGRLQLWAHGQHPGAARLAASMGFERARSLWQMRRPLSAPIPQPSLPEGVAVRTFEVGADEQAWLEVNARAFADHPEQGGVTLEDLHNREREPWFDPRGFFLAERDGRLVGFHWTKVHGAGEQDHGHDPLGEVYVVGVDPSEQGQGLGRALTIVGLEHLRQLGLGQVMLYVEGDNPAAIRVYESLGFGRWDTDVLFRR